MGVQTAHIPSALAPGLETEDFENRSLYDLLRSRGLWLARARETHCASVADRAAARLLGADVFNGWREEGPDYAKGAKSPRGLFD